MTATSNTVDGTDTNPKPIKGERVPMTLGMGQHGEIAGFMNVNFRNGIARSDQRWVSKQMVISDRSNYKITQKIAALLQGQP